MLREESRLQGRAVRRLTPVRDPHRVHARDTGAFEGPKQLLVALG